MAPRARAARIRSRTIATPRGSVPEAGSSRKSRSGSPRVAWATPMRCSMPAGVGLEPLAEGEAIEADAVGGRADLRRRSRRVSAGKAPVKGEEIGAREIPVEAQPFGHVAGAGSDPEIVHRTAVDRDGSRIGPQESEQARQERRLAGAVAPDQAERLAAANRQRHSVERAGAPAQAAVGLRNGLDHDHAEGILTGRPTRFRASETGPNRPTHQRLEKPRGSRGEAKKRVGERHRWACTRREESPRAQRRTPRAAGAAAREGSGLRSSP